MDDVLAAGWLFIVSTADSGHLWIIYCDCVDGGIENVYTVKFNNMGRGDQSYQLSVAGVSTAVEYYQLVG